MLQLCIDTSTEKAVIALAYGEELLQEAHLPLGLQNSKLLFPSLLELLEKEKITPGNLEMISCGVGPGSYTGIRVGAAAAQSMAYALRIPLVGLSGMESLAPEKEGEFVLMLDARIGGLYVLQGKVSGQIVRFEGGPQAISPEECIRSLDPQVPIYTPHRDAVMKKMGPLFSVEERLFSAKSFAKCAYGRYCKGNYNLKGELELLYLRKHEAERC